MAELGPNAEPVDDPAGELLRQLYAGDRHCECLAEGGLTVYCACGTYRFLRDENRWVPQRNIWVMVSSPDVTSFLAHVPEFREQAFRDAVERCLHRVRSDFVLDVLSRQ